MTGIERRSQERIRVRIPCEVELDGRRGTGTVRDLSAGGLCVLTELTAQEGDEIRVNLRPKGGAALEIQAMVWNRHGVRSRRGGDPMTRLGLVLSEADDAFLDLLHASDPDSPEAFTAPARPAASPPAAKTGGRPPERKHRVRVKQAASSRTRMLVVFAVCSDEARARAKEETGDEWDVLDVTPERAQPGLRRTGTRTRKHG